MMKHWRMGIIGCGWAGEQHARAMGLLSERVALCALADVNVVVVVRPDPEAASRYTQLYRLYKRVAQSLAPIYHALTDFAVSRESMSLGE